MSLTLKSTITVADKDASALIIKDTTGTYNVSTNPGGYGVSNSFITPTQMFLKYKTWTDTAWVQVLLTGDQLTDILSSDGLEATPVDLGSTGDVFPDGIDQVELFPLNDTAINGTFTNGSKIVNLSTTSWDPSTYAGLVLYVAGIDGATYTKILEIDATGTNNTAQLTLKEAYDGTTQTLSLWFGPYKDVKVLVNKAAEKCIATTLGSMSPIDCSCSNDASKVNKMIQWRFTADVLFNCDDFTGAHNTLVQLNRLCSTNSATCACF